MDVAVDVPHGARTFSANVWDRIGNHLELVAQDRPNPGPRIIHWNPDDAVAGHLVGNTGVIRVAIDDRIGSSLVALAKKLP